MAEEVKTDSNPIHRAWRKSTSGEFWIELRTTPDSSGSEDAFAQAVSDASFADDGGSGLFGQFATKSPRGFATLLEGARSEEHLDAWLADLGSRLAHLGFAGVFRTVIQPSKPKWLTSEHPHEHTAYISWCFDIDAMAADEGRRGRWFVPADATRRITDHIAAWATVGGPQILMRRDLFRVALDGSHESTISAMLAEAIATTGMAALTCSTPADQHSRVVELVAAEETTFQVAGGKLPWRDRTDHLRAAMTALPDLMNQAFIRPTTRSSVGWSHIGVIQPIPNFRDPVVRYNKHLLDRHVPDAHGIQILRDAHLANASDLSGWSITDLGHGRHLVEAPDLKAWYANVLPEPDTIAQARRDFGAMIINPDTIAAYPPPWTRGAHLR